MLTDATINAMLEARIVPGATNMQLSIHTDYSATGTNLHGSKVDCDFGAAASRAIALDAAVDLTVTGAVTIKWIGVWSSGGTTFQGMYPNGGTDRSFQVDLTNNRIYCEGHGMANDDKVTFHGDTAPTGLTAGTTYFVVGVTAADPDYFQAALTQGGAAIDLTGQAGAACVTSEIVEEVYAAGGTHRVNTLTIAI
jgi:hypothetical protein